MFYAYILQSITRGTYYIGVTACMEKRLIQHNRGYVKSTKYKRPWQLCGHKSFKTLGMARSFENKLKSMKKRERLEEIIKHF